MNDKENGFPMTEKLLERIKQQREVGAYTSITYERGAATALIHELTQLLNENLKTREVEIEKK